MSDCSCCSFPLMKRTVFVLLFQAHFTAFSWLALHCHSPKSDCFLQPFLFSSTWLNSTVQWTVFFLSLMHTTLLLLFSVCGLEAFKVNEKQSSLVCCCTFLSSCVYIKSIKTASFSWANFLLRARSFLLRLFSVQLSRLLALFGLCLNLTALFGIQI